MDDRQYAGFWLRTGAAIIDSVLIMLLIFPLLTLIYGGDYWSAESLVLGPLDFILNFILPAIVVVLFWISKSATPGKMVLKLIIVDAETGKAPSTGQYIGRYLGYYVSMIPMLLGIFWVGFDKRKQGWHDKLAGTVVVRKAGPTSASS